MSNLPTPSSSKKATPKSGKQGSKKRKNVESEEGSVKKLRYLDKDSDDDSHGEEEGPNKVEWKMMSVEKEPPKRPNSKYVQTRKGIQLRDGKATPPWWKIAKVLRTEKRMSDKPEDKGDNKLKDFFFTLARPVEQMDVEQLSGQSSICTPLSQATPENLVMKNNELTAAERQRALDTIKAAGWNGLPVPGTNYNVAYRKPDTSKGGNFYRPYWSLITTGAVGTKFVCTFSGCFSRNGTRKEEFPKCRNHKGEKVGFVVGQFTDGQNNRHEVIFHALASFTYMDGDEEGKNKNAADEMTQLMTKSGNIGNTWKTYCQERISKDKPKPEAKEDESRRLYFDDEDEAMKIYAARQTVTLLKMLLWPNTTTKIICLNEMISLPNGAYKEFKEEMDFWGIELRVHDTIKPEDAKSIILSVPFVKLAEKGDTVGSMLQSKDEGNDDDGEDADEDKKVKDKKKKEESKFAVLYFVSNPYILYAGQTTNKNVHSSGNSNDPVIDYKNQMGNDPPYNIIPIGLVKDEEKYKWEVHYHLAAFFASVLKMPNCINPEDYKNPERPNEPLISHPYCINKQTTSKYFDKKSLSIINELMKKHFFSDVYMGSV